MSSQRMIIKYSICTILFVVSTFALESQTDLSVFTGTLERSSLDLSFEYPEHWLLPQVVNHDGQILLKEDVISRLQDASLYWFIPADVPVYHWDVYGKDGAYALLLTDEDDSTFWAVPGEPLADIDIDSLDSLEQINDYTLLSVGEMLQAISELDTTNFSTSDVPIHIVSRDEAAQVEPKYTYDPESDSFTDNMTDAVYTAQIEGLYGRFVTDAPIDENALAPGFTLFAHSIPFAEDVELATNSEALQGEQGVVAHIGVGMIIADAPPIDFTDSDPQIRLEAIVEIYSFDYADDILLSTDSSTASIDYTYNGGMSGLEQSCIVMTRMIEEIYIVFANLCTFDDDVELYRETFTAIIESIVVSR